MLKPLQVTPIKTKVFRAGDDLVEFIIASLVDYPLNDSDVLVITSKIVSIAEGRMVSPNGIDKQQLIINEADYDLGEVGYGCRLTIKDGLFIPSAGIDESNSESGDYILYPKDSFQSAQRLQQEICRHFQLASLGILITDSHTLPLRKGVTGIALAYWGFQGVKNMIGQKDLFRRELKMTKMDIADGLASAAVLMMGEADESCPLALIKNAPIAFCQETSRNEIQISPQEDLYYPLYKARSTNLI